MCGPPASRRLTPAQRVTADFESQRSPLPGAPTGPLARPGGIGGVAAPMPPGELFFFYFSRVCSQDRASVPAETTIPPWSTPLYCL